MPMVGQDIEVNWQRQILKNDSEMAQNFWRKVI
jgi:hypothetical protein